MAAWEAEAAAVGRTLQAVVGELVAAWRNVTVDFPWGSLTGVAVHAAGDLVCVDGSRRWDVRLPAVLRVRGGGPAEAVSSWTTAPSFSARLREVRSGRRIAAVRCIDGVALEAPITEVGGDYLIVAADERTVVPIPQIAAVAAG